MPVIQFNSIQFDTFVEGYEYISTCFKGFIRTKFTARSNKGQTNKEQE